jgi:micrococcal nuclease
LIVAVALAGLALAVARLLGSFDVPVFASGASRSASGQPRTGADAIAADVVRVFDGDTIEVRIDGREARVRFLGVDTPERRDLGAHEVLYEEAKRFTERELLGETVTLIADRSGDDRDPYDRLLRYVVLDDGTDLNEALIHRGLGLALTRWPFARADAYVEAEAEAIRAERGLWSSTSRIRVPWQKAPDLEGEIVEVEGRLVSTRCLASVCFLNFDPDYPNHVSGVILRQDLHRFEGDPAETYGDRTVRILGEVRRYRGRPQILLRSPAQIEIVD